VKQCPNCAAENAPEAGFCVQCGAAQRNVLPPVPPQYWQRPYQPPQYHAPPGCPFPVPYGAAQNNSGMVVWATVNMVLSSGLAFGVIALVFAMTAKSAWTKQEYESKMRTAKICNIIGTICTALVILAGIAYAAVMLVLLFRVPSGAWGDFGEPLHPLVLAR